MSKKRIAFYYNLSFGGALYTMEEFAKRLSEKYHIDLYTMEDQLEILSSKKYFKQVYLYKSNERKFITGGPFLRIQEDYNLFYRLKKLHKKIASDIDKQNYDIVIVSHDKNCQTPLLMNYLKSKMLYYCQEPTRRFYEYSLNPVHELTFSLKKIYFLLSDNWRKQTDIQTARSATKILSNSYSSNESIYRAYGIYPFVCHLGVNIDIFISLNIKKENFIYAIGNLSPHKGHKFIIDAVSLIPQNKRPRLVIATGGVDMINATNLSLFAKSKEVDLQILEKISEKQHIEMYNKAQVTICAAHLETLGLSALESMACGTPVIAVREGGYRDIIEDKKTGFFVNRDTKELAQTIRKLLEGKLQLQHVVKEARESLMPYWSWEQAVKRLEKHMESIL